LIEKPEAMYQILLSKIEKYLPFLSVLFFILGIGLAKQSSGFAGFIDQGIGFFINSYGFIAPLAIYGILTPSLIKMLESQSNQNSQFARYTIFWFSRLRLLACLWAVIFTTIVFDLPIFTNGTVGLGGAILKTIKSLGWMLSHSPYFYALYASVLTVILSLRFPRFFKFMNHWSEGIEKSGGFFVAIVPFFMLAVGSYVCNLPNNLEKQIGDVSGSVLGTFDILGIKINSATSGGMILAYLSGAFLTGAACMAWHFWLLFLAKIHVKRFSIRNYFRNYWLKVYPLLWSTSSEALATPLNLYLVQKYYSGKNEDVRRFVVGLSSYMNINGTVICVFILAGLVAKILNIQISCIQLLFSIPVVFLIAYGVPGIPGELLLFGGPIVLLFNLPPEVVPIFLALYLGIQIGLPDSFRTGANSTDACPSFLILEDIYEKRFGQKEAIIKKEGAVEQVLTSIEEAPLLKADSSSEEVVVSDVKE